MLPEGLFTLLPRRGILGSSGCRFEPHESAKKQLVVDRGSRSLLPHLSGSCPELDFRRAETQVALTPKPSILGPAVASQ